MYQLTISQLLVNIITINFYDFFILLIFLQIYILYTYYYQIKLQLWNL